MTSPQKRRRIGARSLSGRFENGKTAHQCPEPGDKENGDAKQGPSQMNPKFPQRGEGIDLHAMELGPVGNLPQDESQTQGRGQQQADHGQRQLRVSGTAPGQQGAAARQGKIARQTTPSRLAAKRPARSECQRDFHTRTSAHPKQTAGSAGPPAFKPGSGAGWPWRFGKLTSPGVQHPADLRPSNPAK